MMSDNSSLSPSEAIQQRNILYFAWADQRDKVCFIFHKVQGCCMEKKHSYEVNLFIVFAPQPIPEGENCIFAYQHSH